MYIDRESQYGIEAFGKEDWNKYCNKLEEYESKKTKVFYAMTRKGVVRDLFEQIRTKLPALESVVLNADDREGAFRVYGTSLTESDATLAQMFESVSIDTFCHVFQCNYPKDSVTDYPERIDIIKRLLRDNVAIEASYYMSIDFSYTCIGGGSNSVPAGRATFHKGKWLFETVKEYK